MIHLSGITKTYGTLTALNNIDLAIQQSEIFGIIGKSGAGKSTLLRCINLLERPDVGQVIINSKNLLTLSSQELKKVRYQIAMIFQHFHLLQSKTVYENIALPMHIQGQSHTEITRKISELLPLVELSEKKHAYPSELSGGQKQRVAIARALACSPSILLCDEATSALDPKTTEAILNLLKKINEIYGITIVLITHEMDVVKRICHRLAVMEKGSIVEDTTLAQAFRNQDSYARHMLYAQLSPELPACLRRNLTQTPTHKPLLRLLFEGEGATVPFISQTSQALKLDINILLANIDRVDAVTFGVLVVELEANQALLNTFIQRCETFGLTVEVLGYVAHAVL